MDITDRKKYGDCVYPYHVGDIYNGAKAVKAVRDNGEKCSKCAFYQKALCRNVSCHTTMSRLGVTRDVDFIYVWT